MQIASLEVRHVRIRLKRPVKHASHARTDTENIVVVCTLSDGKIGYGEAVPREYVTGETIDSSFDLLKRSDLAAQLPHAHEFEQVVRIAEKLQLPQQANDDRMCAGNAARCALELAYLDAYGKALGEPLMNVTRFICPELYEPHERVQYSGVILSAKGWKARLASTAYRWLGFQQVKVKVGIPGQNDTERLAAIRKWAGPNIDLRVDANEAWSASEVAGRIQALEPFQMSSVEQPVPHEAVSSLAEIRKQVKTPIMLDESLCGEVDAERAIRGGWCDLFNLRLSKCGGYIPTLKLAALAARHNLGYQLGCQVGETGILSAAGRQFACSVKGLRALEGSFDRHLVHEALSRDDITFSRRGGWAPMLTGSGTGVTVDPAALDSITQRREVLIG
jgi:L-Ala-D/L-Glu epimerase